DATVSPALTLSDFDHTLMAIYRRPQPYLDFEGMKKRTSESVKLVRREELRPSAILQTRRVSTPGGVSVSPEFYWPDYRDAGFVIIKPSRMGAGEKTTISGLTAEPLVLTSEYSQTYAPGHHNFWEDFLFEPRLDPGVTPAQLAELEAADIQWI